MNVQRIRDPLGFGARHRSLSPILRVLTTFLVAVVALGACSNATGTENDVDQPATDEATPTTMDDLSGIVDDDTIEILGVYGVDGDDLTGEVPEDYFVVWERFAQLFPSSLRPEVIAFVAIDSELSGGTDGAMQTSADDPSLFYIALDAVGNDDDRELDRTMIHEYGHLLTLRPSQIPIDPDAYESCPVYTGSYEGCPTEDAYLRDFSEQFWPGYTIEDEDADTEQTIEDRNDEDEFVTEYAATNPSEDLAEVFAEWVLADNPATGSTLVDQKLRFWDDYPEVVALRLDIRDALGY